MSLSLPKVNTHIHLPPNFSAFSTVDEALVQAAVEGIEILGASNYYDFSVYGPFAQEAQAKGIQALFGIEIVCRVESLVKQGVKINDPGNPGKMYLCGKAIRTFEHPTQRAAEILSQIRSGDVARMNLMVDLLTRVFRASGSGLHLDAAGIIAHVANQSNVSLSTVVLQERHVAQAFQEAVFASVPVNERTQKMSDLFRAPSKAEPTDAVVVQAEIRTHLMKAGRPAFVDEQYVTFDEARELIEELGGIVCYPVLADGMNPMSGFESDPHELANRLKDLGIGAAEFIPNRNDLGVLAEYVEVLSANGFLLSAGTEHNTTERIQLVPECKGGVPIPDAIQELFVQGALRQVEHQNQETAEA